MVVGFYLLTGPVEHRSINGLAHPIVILFVHLGQLALKVQIDGKVQIPVVTHIRLHLERAVNFLALLHRQIVVKVKHGLLPVRIRGVRCRTEGKPLVALGKLHVKVRHQRLDKVVALHRQVEGGFKL
uniref:Uncharacterized protein n=1 Tax=Anopheles christyi TaxID=43041 RepID=A0A182KIP7_9DIPT